MANVEKVSLALKPEMAAMMSKRAIKGTRNLGDGESELQILADYLRTTMHDISAALAKISIMRDCLRTPKNIA